MKASRRRRRTAWRPRAAVGSRRRRSDARATGRPPRARHRNTVSGAPCAQLARRRRAGRHRKSGVSSVSSGGEVMRFADLVGRSHADRDDIAARARGVTHFLRRRL